MCVCCVVQVYQLKAVQVPPHKCQEKLLQATRSIISLLRERDSLVASLGTREGRELGGALEVKGVGEGGPLEVKGVGEGGPLEVKGVGEGGPLEVKGVGEGGPLEVKGVGEGGPLEVKGVGEGGPLEVKGVGEGGPLEVKGVGEGGNNVSQEGLSNCKEISECVQVTCDIRNPVGQTEGGRALPAHVGQTEGGQAPPTHVGQTEGGPVQSSSSKNISSQQQVAPQQLQWQHDSLSSLNFSESEVDCQKSSLEQFLLLTDDILSTSPDYQTHTLPDHQAHMLPSLTPGC